MRKPSGVGIVETMIVTEVDGVAVKRDVWPRSLHGNAMPVLGLGD